jgi:alpha-L-fucosidase
MRPLFVLLICSCWLTTTAQSIDSSFFAKRIPPPWYDSVKLGIMIHWGIYSVPGFSADTTIERPHHWSEPLVKYGEWYWHSQREGYEPVASFHQRVYGAGTTYPELASRWQAELFDPGQWADLFQRAGAGYVVLVAKHHDGFALWPSAYSWNWNSAELGPKRDLVGDITDAVRRRGLRMGYSYSLDAWYDPLFLGDFPRYVQEQVHPQLKELVRTYRPDILVPGGHGAATAKGWGSPEFLRWLYHDSPVGEQVVVNDRWGRDVLRKFGDYATFQYSDVDTKKRFQGKWEEMRSLGGSFGYSRTERAEDFMSADSLIETLVKVVARGGNLLLNVGPTAEGRIPPLVEDRLLELGRWLALNGEAIYGSQAWPNDYFLVTQRSGQRYLFLLDWPGATVSLPADWLSQGQALHLLGLSQPLTWRKQGDQAVVEIPLGELDPSYLRHVYVLRWGDGH